MKVNLAGFPKFGPFNYKNKFCKIASRQNYFSRDIQFIFPLTLDRQKIKKVALRFIWSLRSLRYYYQTAYKFWDSLPKLKHPKCKSCFTLVDGLLICVGSFLTKYQTNESLIPFTHFDMRKHLLPLLETIVKPKVLRKV